MHRKRHYQYGLLLGHVKHSQVVMLISADRLHFESGYTLLMHIAESAGTVLTESRLYFLRRTLSCDPRGVRRLSTAVLLRWACTTKAPEEPIFKDEESHGDGPRTAGRNKPQLQNRHRADGPLGHSVKVA